MATIKIDGRAIHNHWMSLSDTTGKFFQRTDILPSYRDSSWYFNGGIDFATAQQIPTFDLPDGTYSLNPQGAANFSFVIKNGKVDYGNDCDGFLTGRGTNQLVLKGFAVTIDARYLIGNGLTFWGVLGFGPGDPKGKSDQWVIHKTCTLLPGTNYYFVVGSGLYGDFYFSIGKDGKLTMDTKYAAFMRVENNHTVIINGFPILLDGILNGSAPLGLFGVYNLWDTPFADNHTNWSNTKVLLGNFVPTWEVHGYIPFNAPKSTSGVSKAGFRVCTDGTVVVSDIKLLKTDTFNGIRRVTILKTLTDK